MALTAGACDPTPSAQKAIAPRKIDVLAVAYPMADIVRQIGRDRCEVRWLAEGGRYPEELRMDAPAIQDAHKAQLIVTSGRWDNWAERDLTLEARAAKLVLPQSMDAAQEADPRAYAWLDPRVVGEVIEAVRQRLTVIDPGGDGDFRTAATACREEINRFDREMRSALERHRGRKVLAIEARWGAMMSRYGLVSVTPLAEDRGQLLDEDLRRIAQVAKEQRFKSIFVDAAMPAAIRQRIADRTGLRIRSLDSLGTSAPAGRSTWLKIMRYNLEELKKFLEEEEA